MTRACFGTFHGIAATGRAIRTQELVIYRVADGRIAECWGDLGSTVRDELVSGVTGRWRHEQRVGELSDSGKRPASPAGREDWHSSSGRGSYGRRMVNRYEYTVVELRERMIGGKMSGDKLQQALNEHAAQGWQLKAITSVEVRGRVGPGGVEGLLVTFERPVG